MNRWLRAAPVVALLLTVAVLGAVTVARARAASAAEADRAEVVAVAGDLVRDFITVDAGNVREKVDHMQRVAADPFRAQLGSFATAFGAILAQGRVRADGRVDSAAVERLEDAAATVLVSASTTVRNVEVPDGAPRNYRLVVGLSRVGEGWRVSTVEVAP